MGANDDDPDGTGGGEPGGGDPGEGEPPANDDGGEEGAGGDGGGDAGDGGEGTPPPAKPKGKPAGGDGGGGDPPDPITAGLSQLGERLEGVVKEQGEGLRGEMAQLKRDVDNRIELAEARYGRGTGSGANGGAGGPGAATQPRQKAWWEKLFW